MERRGVTVMNQELAQNKEDYLWKQWKKNKDDQVANELVQMYMHLVTYHVERMVGNVPANIRREDLESYALMGLFDALNKFEPDRDLKFNTYASYRIRGAIIDGLRKEDWLPRSLRDQVKRVEETSEKLEQQLNKTPSSEDIARELNMTTEEVETIYHHSLYSHILSIDRQPQTGDQGDLEDLKIILEDEQGVKPDEHLMRQEALQILSQKIKTLNENEQIVISLFYYDELTMTEIGEVLDLTTSRISQIHKSALFKLRNTLKELQLHF